MVGLRSTGLCREYHFAMRARLILEAPFLAGRLDNVTYSYRTAEWRDAYPGASAYVNGGISRRSTSF
jgi:hypothetical protein